MKKELSLALLPALFLFVLMSPITGDHDETHLLSYTDLLHVFTAIASPYEETKSSRNLQTDKQVDGVIDKIRSIIPEVTKLRNLVVNTSDEVPLLVSNIGSPLGQIKNNLQVTLEKLNKCGHSHDELPGHSSGPSSIPKDERSDEGREAEYASPEDADPDNRGTRDVLNTIGITGVSLDDVLGTFPENSVISLKDATLAFKALADHISQEHGRRALHLAPKVKEVMDSLNSIVDHVTSAQAAVSELNAGGGSFYKNSVTSVQEVANLTSLVLTAAGRVC